MWCLVAALLLHYRTNYFKWFLYVYVYILQSFYDTRFHIIFFKVSLVLLISFHILSSTLASYSPIRLSLFHYSPYPFRALCQFPFTKNAIHDLLLISFPPWLFWMSHMWFKTNIHKLKHATSTFSFWVTSLWNSCFQFHSFSWECDEFLT